jgi:ribosomal protein S18 acetylase RimI-like enzyme
MPQIEIRPVIPTDMTVLQNIDHSYKSIHAWQMDRQFREGHISIKFHEIRLPRPVWVEYPITIDEQNNSMQHCSVMLTAILKNKPVGYICIKEQTSPSTAWVKDLVVDGPARRQGIASGLILAAQEWGLQNNLRRIILEMQSKNHPAIQLAFKLGYEFCGYHDHYYANHDIALFFARFLH